MRTLPEDIIAYKTIGPFLGDKIPAALFKRHNTMKGVWGTLEIISGRVNFIQDDTNETFHLYKGDIHVILPQEPHYLAIPEGSSQNELKIEIKFHKVINK